VKTLGNSEINNKKSLLDEEWELVDIPFLKRTYEFESFKEALEFVNKVAYISKSVNHHPDIFISFNRVNLNIYTHDTNSLTQLDFELAKKIDELLVVDKSVEESAIIDQELLENIEILKNGSDFEKRRASTRLGRIGNADAVPVLIKALKNKDRFVKKAAIRSLGMIKDTRAIPSLIRLLQSEDGEYRYAAKDSLVEIGEVCEDVLISAFESRNYHQREMAIEALGELELENSLQFLKKGLLDDISQVRWRAARAINQWYDEETIKTLKNLFKNDPDIKVREESAKTLKNIENQIKNLFVDFEKRLKFISEDIGINDVKGGKSYFSPEKNFAGVNFNNPHKLRFSIYQGNNRIKNVNPSKADPKWGVIYLQRKEELGEVLEIFKESFIIAKKDYN
jgi:4a-hydroxytetrahydrobiopterin dehydratase